ncbi:MAG: type VI secretion system tip protein VgrG, partial [Betaproteobacteria bacterium]|nr:type VI secretion system tip protein VgrG [Betaproteobacteria bacterium]
MAGLEEKLGDQKRFEFVSKPMGKGKFAVVRMKGVEGISRLYEFELLLVAEDAGIDFEAVLHQPGTLTVVSSGEGRTERYPYHGIVTGFEQLHQVDMYTFYRAVLSPRLWQLSQYRVSEVYVGEDAIPKIVEKVLQDGGLNSGVDYELKLSGEYRSRSYVCQYQETHLDFISRWMEHEGLYYWFEQGEEREKLIVADARNFHAAQARRVFYRPASEVDTGMGEAVRTLSCRQKPLPAKVVVQDYNYRKALLEIRAEAQVSQKGRGEVMFYGENVRDPQADGKRLAQIRAQEILCRGKLFCGESTVGGLRAGFFMELDKHYRKDFNQRYLVTELSHRGSQAAVLLAGLEGERGEGENEIFYRNEFTAIPGEVQYRAERRAPRPRFYGTMNATIDAEGGGQYAQVNEYGQYKVQVPFDRTDKNAAKASAWVRMASPYSGRDHGMHFPLHKGAEVLLCFIDGDPDQPVIVGAVPNSENRNVVTDENQTANLIRTAGDNVLELEDTRGAEHIVISTPHENTYVRMGKPQVRASVGAAAANPGAPANYVVHTEGNMSLEVGKGMKTRVGGLTDAGLPAAGDYVLEAEKAVGLTAKSGDLGLTAEKADLGMAAANNVRLTANTRNLDLRATTGNALLKAGGSMHAEVGAVSGAEAAGDEKGKYTLTVENDITIKTEKGEITIEASQKGCTIKVAGDLKLEVNGKMETRTWGAGAEFHGGAKLDSYLGSMTDIKMANENKIFAG